MQDVENFLFAEVSGRVLSMYFAAFDFISAFCLNASTSIDIIKKNSSYKNLTFSIVDKQWRVCVVCYDIRHP